MPKTKGAKRRDDAPYVPPKKRKALQDTPSSIARRAQMKAILARTGAARAELDARADGADLRELEPYPHVFFPLGPPVVKRGRKPSDDEDELEPPVIVTPTIAPPVLAPPPPPAPSEAKLPRRNRCSFCNDLGHNIRRCEKKAAADLAAAPKARRVSVLTLVERDAIVKALEDAGGNITRAANLLGIFRTVLQRKMERLGLRTATAARSSADSLPVP
jgi:hypothetical protein